jgi:Tfp pilus assembly protein PilP
MQIDAHAWALVSVPDGKIHRVVEGSYLGQNNGKVIAIDLDQSALEIEELLQGPTGRWEIRPIRLGVNH